MRAILALLLVAEIQGANRSLDKAMECATGCWKSLSELSASHNRAKATSLTENVHWKFKLEESRIRSV
ncbi:hypothetical protein TELCIR_11747 [Teladorsagia circumcincta]|uniref:Uncharacterized protein n=1 Tax=Teladorsagia circumcincta TaxID=45464 RepID=A0A2G9U8M4_TELCI|nr:hypothetical protein TELCIR_11747 [Teladorsagia circumcincta]